jgi:hypothetical protein
MEMLVDMMEMRSSEKVGLHENSSKGALIPIARMYIIPVEKPWGK